MTNNLITKQEKISYVDALMWFCKEEGSFEQFEFGKQLIETGTAEITAENKKDMFKVLNVLNGRIFKGFHRALAFTDDLKRWNVQFTLMQRM